MKAEQIIQTLKKIEGFEVWWDGLDPEIQQDTLDELEDLILYTSIPQQAKMAHWMLN